MQQMQVLEPGDTVRHKKTGAEFEVRNVHLRSYIDKTGEAAFYYSLTLLCPHCGEELTGRAGGDYEVCDG